jgi:hypothetical protein
MNCFNFQKNSAGPSQQIIQQMISLIRSSDMARESYAEREDHREALIRAVNI